ncbi:MAG: response regulator transcription factor [Candidatus Marinimicrobia bacterium]|nr:response regulator transcription factor [Candidatus Neomarinimicrobiota bacterium]
MIRLLIADDHVLIREGFRRIVENEIDMDLVGEASNAGEALHTLQASDVDVMVLDISMPGKSGLDFLEEVKRFSPETSVLIQSVHPEDSYAIRALKAGAAGYITKSGHGDELLKAIRKIARGGRYVSESLAEALAFALQQETSEAPHSRLSTREYQVMIQFAEGKGSAEIARNLSLSRSTINTYRSRILEKLDLSRTSDIIHYAIDNRLLDR